MVIFEYLYFTR